MDADSVISILGLQPHPEGGYYLETWADDASTAIYFLLPAGGASAWHRVLDRVEIWHFYAGATLELLIDPDGSHRDDPQSVHLGVELSAGQRPQAVVPAGTWQSARSLGEWSLAGCTVSPPFTFEAFELESP